MQKITILIIVSIVVGVGILSGCSEKTSSGISNIVTPPMVDVTSQNARTGMEGLDYVVYIDVSLHNRGGDGKVTAWAKITQGGSFWTKQQAIYLGAGEMRDLTFTFREISFWDTSSGSYSVWIET